MHTMSTVAVALAGCAGYTGQETLDRVLAHPEFEVVALGSDSLAGEPASALDLRLNGHLPQFVSNAEALASGAGRELKPSSHAGFVLENLAPYKVGAHQHAPEIAAALGFPVCFVPHLLPVRRGLLATCYARATTDDLRGRLEDAYAGSAAV